MSFLQGIIAESLERFLQALQGFAMIFLEGGQVFLVQLVLLCSIGFRRLESSLCLSFLVALLFQGRPQCFHRLLRGCNLLSELGHQSVLRVVLGRGLRTPIEYPNPSRHSENKDRQAWNDPLWTHR